MNDKLSNEISNTNEFGDIDVESHLKFSDITFKDDQLQKYPEKVKMQRAKLIMKLSDYIYQALSYKTDALVSVPGTFTYSIMASKHLLLSSIKNKVITREINKLPCEYSKSRNIKISRKKAQAFIETGECDHTGEKTIFGQILQQIKKDESLLKCFNLNRTDD